MRRESEIGSSSLFLLSISLWAFEVFLMPWTLLVKLSEKAFFYETATKCLRILNRFPQVAGLDKQNGC